MKNFAKLVLLFTISFLVIFLLSTVFRFLALRVDWARSLPVKPETTLTLLIAAGHWALSLSLFASILFSLIYAVRQKFSAVMSIISLIVLSFGLCLGFSVILNNWKAVPPAQISGIPLGGKGLILSNSLNRNETSVVLLNGSEEPLGNRVVSIPGQPLIYQPPTVANTANMVLPPVPFGSDTPWFLQSIALDLNINAGLFQKKFNEGFLSFLIYAGALIFILCSLGGIFKFSVWPMANLFLGILGFRGILALEVFLNSTEIQDAMSSFFKGAFPVSLAIPVLFFGFGVLMHLYSFLIFLSKRRYEDDI